MRSSGGDNGVGRGRRELADPARGSSEVRSHLAGGSRAPFPLPTGDASSWRGKPALSWGTAVAPQGQALGFKSA